jgi:hypothetical protein
LATDRPNFFWLEAGAPMLTTFVAALALAGIARTAAAAMIATI